MPDRARPFIEDAVLDMEEENIPADPIVWGQELDRTMALWNPADWASVSAFYFEAFAHVPRDLAFLALRRARQSCKYCPKPAELRELIDFEMAERKRREVALRLMADKAKRTKPEETGRRWEDMTDERRAEFDKWFRHAVDGLRMNALDPHGRRDRPKPIHTNDGPGTRAARAAKGEREADDGEV